MSKPIAFVLFYKCKNYLKHLFQHTVLPVMLHQQYFNYRNIPPTALEVQIKLQIPVLLRLPLFCNYINI